MLRRELCVVFCRKCFMKLNELMKSVSDFADLVCASAV